MDEDLSGTGISRPRQKPQEDPPPSEETTGAHDLLEDPELLMDTTPAVGGVTEDLAELVSLNIIQLLFPHPIPNYPFM